MKVFYVLVSCWLTFASAKKGKPLPSYLKPCSLSSPELNACALKHAKEGVPHVLKGDKAYKIPVLLPLHLDRVEVKPSDTFELILTNLDAHGLDSVKVKDIKIDPKKKHVDLVLEGDGVKLLSDYSVKGQILVLPISGEGKSDIRLNDFTIYYNFDYSVTPIDGKDFVKVTNSKVDYKVNKATFQLDNLFNGNKELGDNMNKVLNDNQETILKDFSPAITRVVDQIAVGIINQFLGNIPYDEIFLP